MKKTLLFTLALATMSVSNAAVPSRMVEGQRVAEYSFPELNAAKINVAQMCYTSEAFPVRSAAELNKAVSDASMSVSAPAVTALPTGKTPTFLRPSGLYYFGINLQGSAYYNPFMAGPAFVEHTWKNVSNQATKQWNYAIGDMSDKPGPSLVSTDKDLTFEYDSFTFSSIPTLTTADGKTWTTIMPDKEGNPVEGMVVTVSDVTINGKDIFSVSGYPFNGNLELSADEGVYLLGQNDTGLGVEGFGMLMTKPAVPCLLQSVMAIGRSIKIEGSAQLKMNVYSVGDDGMVPEKPAYIGLASAADVHNIAQDQDGKTISIVEFKFFEEDELGGVTEVYPRPDTALYFEIAEYRNLPGVSFEMFYAHYPFIDAQKNLGVAPEQLGFVRVKDEQGKTGLTPIANLYEGLPYTSPSFFINATFENFIVDKKLVELPVAGGQDVMMAASGYKMSQETFFVTTEIPEWLTIYYGEENKEDGTIEVTFQADELPEGTTGREADIAFDLLFGGRQIVHVRQGASSVDGVVVSSSKVTVEGGNFVVSSVDANAVEVFNLSGQKVAEAAFNGEAVVSGAGLASGVYIVKFNDNTVVKVVK